MSAQSVSYIPNTLADLKKRSRWLLQYASNVTSQFGEDGIISKALSLIPDRNGWCVEFGAWDGKYYSNTYNLIANHGYHGVLIEADPARFKTLDSEYDYRERIVPINAVVGFSPDDCLDVRLADQQLPNNYDLLSIDIDGNDYHVWEAARSHRPKFVVIEYNQTIDNSVLYVQEKKADLCEGSSAASLVALGKQKGYELIAATQLNLLFVATEYFSLFAIPDNSLEVMRDDSGTPKIFVGYNGRVCLSHGDRFGRILLLWHGLALSEKKVQLLPLALQKHPGTYTRLQRVLFRLLFARRRVF